MIAAAALVAVSMSLAGCVVVNLPVKPPVVTEPQQTQPPTDGTTEDCTGVDVRLNQPGTYTLTGDCGEITVEGADITVETGNIDALVIRGDRITATSAKVGRIEIGGNGNTISAEDAGGITINGDRNAITSHTVFGVTIGGNDNTVEAKVTGEIVQSGDRNQVG